MATQTRTYSQHGIEVDQVNFSGNWYTTVEGRIAIANHAKIETVRTQPSYSVFDHQILPVGDRWAYTCTVEYPHDSGHYYPGSDFIDMTDKTGLAKAETSAIGRALGLAGIANENGIASAEEMARVTVEHEPEPPQAHDEPKQEQPTPIRPRTGRVRDYAAEIRELAGPKRLNLSDEARGEVFRRHQGKHQLVNVVAELEARWKAEQTGADPNLATTTWKGGA